MAQDERRLAAIVQADVVGFSRLIGLDVEGTLARLREHRGELIDPKILEHDGRIVKTMGDGLLVEFHSVVNAVRCAIAIQAGMAVRNAGLAEDHRLEFRIGVHLGDVVVDGDDIYGDGVNVAARLEALAVPGGICLSRAARDQVRDRIGVPLEDQGEIKVKNITRPIQVFKIASNTAAPPKGLARIPRYHRYGIAAVVAAVIVFYSYEIWFSGSFTVFEPAAVERMAHSLPDIPSVAMLPFDNMSDDAAQDYFADGMIEDLITDLSKVPGLFVIARNSTFTYKGRSVKVQQVAEELGVRYVVEGSVRRAGDKLRINVQLIDALSGRHIWADRYDRDMADIFALQDEITRAIVTELAVKLVPGRTRTATVGATNNPAAYDALLRGWNYLDLRRNDPRNFVLARDQFAKALRLDPGYSRAHLALAATYWWSSWAEQNIRMGVAFQEGIDRAKSYLKTAMENPTALGHRIQSEMYRWEGQYDLAITAADRAIAIDPNNPEGYGAKAAAQLYVGQPDLALANLDKADRLDPKNLAPNWIRHGMARLMGGDNEKAAQLLQYAVAAEPEFDWTYRFLISAYGHLGRMDKAKAAIKRVNKIRKAKGAGPFTLTYAMGNIRFKRARDRDYYRLGLEKAGLPAGGDVTSTKTAMDTILSRTKDGHYTIVGATKVSAQ